MNRALRGRLRLAPAGLWLAAFLVAPMVVIAEYSLATRDPGLGHVVRPYTSAAYRRALDPAFLPIFLRTLAYAASATVLCVLIGLPLAWFVARHAGRWRPVLLIAVLIPFWSSYLARIYAWKALLDGSGPIGRLSGEPGGFLLTHGAVVLGLTYGLLPFMVLPLYVAGARFDGRLLDASADLGAGRLTTLTRVLLPGLAPGLVAGSLLVFVPATGDFVTPNLLGGVGQTTFGSVLDDQFRSGNNWPLGSAMAILLLIITVLGLVLAAGRTEPAAGGRGAGG